MPKRVNLEGQVIVDHDRLARTLKVLRTQGKIVTLLCADIDVLSPAAVRALKSASNRGQHLVVGLLDDATLTARDGHPPLLMQDERAEVVAGVDGVDYVTLVDSQGVQELVRTLRPAVVARCNGEDAKGGQIEEEWAKEVGAKWAVVGDSVKVLTNRRFRKLLDKRGLGSSGFGAEAKGPSNSKASTTKKAAARKDVTRSPVAKKPAAKKPVAKKLAAKKAAAKKPAAKKSAAKKPAAKKKARATA